MFRFGQQSSRRLLCAVLLAGGMIFPARAAPFDRTFVFTQPDGTIIQLHGRGDEYAAIFETTNGYAVVFNHVTGAYEYARRNAAGDTLESTGAVAGKDDPVAVGLLRHVRIDAAARRAQTHARWQWKDQTTGRSDRWRARREALRAAAGPAEAASTSVVATAAAITLSPPVATTIGFKQGLCLLVDFSDATGTVSQAEIANFCNSDNYTGFHNNGSVKKYFQDVSNHLLTYSNVVTAYVRVPYPKSYYNNTSTDCGTAANNLIYDAIAALRALPGYATTIQPALAGLTADSSSNVVACNVFFAGNDSGVWDYGLWPHSWVLSDVGAQALWSGGKKIWNYQISNIGSSLELGTFCHENGHMLCDYPDLYDYGSDSEGGAGAFCLMGYGLTYGSNPVQICAYLKRASGWAVTTDLTAGSVQAATLSASAGTNFNHFYRVVKAGTPTEYFLLENRQQTSHDAWLPAAGIAVWHIDELGDRDNQSLLTNSAHANYEVTLVQADNLWHFENNVNTGDANDLYYAGNTAVGYANRIDDTTGPSSGWWDGSRSGLIVWGFGAPAADMTINMVCWLPPQVILDHTTLSYEECLPANGFIDPGERVTLDFALRNAGGSDASNVVADLLPGGGVNLPGGSCSYGTLPAGGKAVTQSYSFLAGGSIGSNLTATLRVRYDGGGTDMVSAVYTLGQLVMVTNSSQNFDSVTAPALPAGWTTTKSGVQSYWTTVASGSDSAPNAIFAPDPAGVGESDLLSPSISITTAAAQLSFRNRYQMESSYDGGVLEISLNGGAFADILSAGGSFVSNCYNGSISPSYQNPLFGRTAWTGNSGGYLTTIATLPAAAKGRNVQFKWRCGSDNSIAGAGWWIDTVSVSEPTYVTAVCTSAPAIACTAITNGQITLTVSGGGGPTFVVETCTNLLNPIWNASTNTVMTLPFIWSDTNAAAPARFYRVRRGP